MRKKDDETRLLDLGERSIGGKKWSFSNGSLGCCMEATSCERDAWLEFCDRHCLRRQLSLFFSHHYRLLMISHAWTDFLQEKKKKRIELAGRKSLFSILLLFSKGNDCFIPSTSILAKVVRACYKYWHIQRVATRVQFHFVCCAGSSRIH